MNDTIKNTDLKQQLVEDFAKIESQLNGQSNSEFNTIRRVAMERFEAEGFPVKKMEMWKYTSLKKLVETPFTNYFEAKKSTLTDSDLAKFQIPGLDAHKLVFVNGSFQSQLSSNEAFADGISVVGLTEARNNKSELFFKYFGHVINTHTDALDSLNTAFCNQGVFVHAAKGKSEEKPVHIINIHDTRDGNVCYHPRHLIVAEENSEVHVMTSNHTIGEGEVFMNGLIEIHAAADAHVECVQLQADKVDQYIHQSTHIKTHKGTVVNNFTITLSGKIVRNNKQVILNQDHSEVSLFGLYLLNGKQHVDNFLLVDHALPNCLSNQLYKGIMDDTSTGVFNGRIMVRKDAQKTNAFQSNNNLILNDGATINTKPQLEIFADDVKCSHGATSAQLDHEHMFFLRSRGLSEATAKKMLLNAFLSDVVTEIKSEAVVDYVEQLIADKIN
ncbi:MAG: Fe-S cluster assembly protein SufD [Sphingobacteriales bacterium]|jgi:Fe-S cluster assembly protein SufD